MASSILIKIDEYRWRLPKAGEMNTEGIIYADRDLVAQMDRAVQEQLKGVASLPGIVGPALAMPDAHQGYGFPIGGVAAFDPARGVVSPGGVGYDINCGVRLLRSRVDAAELERVDLEGILDALFSQVPCGVGVGGALKCSERDLEQIMTRGAAWAVGRGLGRESDLEFCESGGGLPGADPGAVSPRALKRGGNQVGTLGSGNHFVELGVVDQVFDRDLARAFGLEAGMMVVWIHSGSRGLGHQVCDDYLRELGKSADALHPRDRQLVAAPPDSAVGRRYLGAMAAAANYAFANRQVLTHLVRRALAGALGRGEEALGLGLVYDVAHNVAKLERHQYQGRERELWVHRKGATRALGPGHPELPPPYRRAGQPVLVPGDMGRASFVLAGTARAQAETWASAAHGAGRLLSRRAAKKRAKGRRLDEELGRRGVLVRARGWGSLAEEMPEAYKDATQVVQVMHGAGVARLVARTRPLVVVKG